MTTGSRPVRLINAVGGAVTTVLPVGPRLDVDRLLQAATRRTGLKDFGDPHFREGLDALIGSLARDCQLQFIGKVSIGQIIVDCLVNRLLLTRTRTTAPAVFEQPLVPPLVVLGLPRSGTTLLHRLLAEDPRHHAPPYWELVRPIADSARRDDRRRNAERGLGLRKFLSTELDAKHLIAADLPEEDLFTLGATFESWYFWMMAPVHGYIDWYRTQDHEQKYREYRSWLQVLQATHPGRRLVLKSPEHTGGLAALLAAVPEAIPIQTHRDPLAAFTSYVNLNRTAQSMFTVALDAARSQETSLQLLEDEAQRCLRARAAHPGAVIDVFYDDLIADPQGSAKRIYQACGLDLTDDAAAAMDRYVADNPQGKHGLHHYSLDGSRFTTEDVRSRFSEYNRQFGFARLTAAPRQPIRWRFR